MNLSIFREKRNGNEVIKKMADYKIFMRGDERYAVQDANGKPINGEEKVKILVAEDLIKVAAS